MSAEERLEVSDMADVVLASCYLLNLIFNVCMCCRQGVIGVVKDYSTDKGFSFCDCSLGTYRVRLLNVVPLDQRAFSSQVDKTLLRCQVPSTSRRAH